MKILIIGGTGYISGYLAHHLVEAGHAVTIMTRAITQNPLFPHEKVTCLQADRRNELSFRAAVRNTTFDAVYDMISYHPEHSEIAVRVLCGKVGRFIHCSTVSVYMVSDQVRCPIIEDQDTLPVMPSWDRNPFGMEYGILKRRCEDVLWKVHDEKSFPVSMLRPTYVCGPNDPIRRDYFWIQRLLDSNPVLVPGSGDHAFHPVYVGDVSRAFVSLLCNEKTVGEAYTIAGGEIFSLNEYLFRLASMLGVNSTLIHVPQHIFDSLRISASEEADVFPFNTRRTAVFSIEKIKQHLGFQPTPFDQWMPETIKWYKNIEWNSPGYEFRRMEVNIALKYSELINKTDTTFKQVIQL